MKPTSIKTLLNLSVLTVLFFAASSHCFAMISLASVSKQQAKELGMEIRLKDNGPNEVWVELEFKTEGKFKDFNHVSLEIGEEKTLLLGWSPLKEERTSSGGVVVRFLANRAYLDKITLRVVVGSLSATGYDLRVRDFVEPAKAP